MAFVMPNALRDAMRARASAPSGVLRRHNVCAMCVSWGSKDRRGYGATAARLTPDQKVGSSNLSGLILRMTCERAVDMANQTRAAMGRLQ